MNKKGEITNLLEQIVKFEEIVVRRASELAYANGCKHEIYIDSVDFDVDRVDVSFTEDTSYDCPNKLQIGLGMQTLVMNDREWDEYINRVKSHTAEAEKNIREAKQAEEKAIRREQYLKFKEEFGKKS